MKPAPLLAYLQLRLVVGYLGEKNQFGWWPTAFFDPASPRFLEPVFTKTWRLAQYHGIREAARRLHDEHIGIGRVFHLFRLPEEVEHDLHLLVEAQQVDPDFFALIANQAAGLEFLAKQAGSANIEPSVGPTAIGQAKNLSAAQAARQIARTYLAAFTHGTKAYPYFLNEG